MKDKKVLTSWGTSAKRTIVGLKSLWQDGPKIMPYVNTFYQKRPSLFVKKDGEHYELSSTRPDDEAIIFNPNDYEANSNSDARRMALEDAKNHKKFYQALIDRGIYPAGSKVRIRKAKHSNRFVIELKVPKLQDLDSYYESIRRSSGDNREELNSLKYDSQDRSWAMESEAKKFGYHYSDPENPRTSGINEDTLESFNYGVDSKGVVRYFDKHVLKAKLPFKGRRKSDLEIQLEDYSNQHKNTETDVNKIISSYKERALAVAVIWFLSGIFFFSTNITGNVIGLSNVTSSWIGGVLILIGLIALGFWIKNRKRGKLVSTVLIKRKVSTKNN